MTTQELRDELARMAGWTRLRQPDGFADGWRHADGDRAMTHPIPSTLDGLVEIWPDNHGFGLLCDIRPNEERHWWTLPPSESQHETQPCPVNAVLTDLLRRVQTSKDSYPTAFAAWQRKVQEQSR